MKNDFNLKDLSRAGYVKRWHIVRTLREQSIAEHQWMVAMIAERIADLIEGSDKPSIDRLLMIRWALHHDVPEIALGDVPTTTKRVLEQMQSDAFGIVEESVSEKFDYLVNKAGHTIEGAVVKLADMLDAIGFLNNEGHGGHADEIKDLIIGFYEPLVASVSKRFPNYEWTKAFTALDEVLNGTVNRRQHSERPRLNKRKNPTKNRNLRILNTPVESEGGEA